jgi:hypothetical protein
MQPFRDTTSGLKVKKDYTLNTLKVNQATVIPPISSNDLPPPINVGSGGGIAYDIITKRVYYSDGSTWLPLAVAGGGGGSNVSSYSLSLSANQTIPSLTSTVITGMNNPGFPFHTLPEWNLATGTYTAALPVTFTISVDLSWTPGSNLGTRYLRILHNGVSIKEAVTQPDAQANLPTTQTTTQNLFLAAGDTVQIQVYHTALTNLSVSGGGPPNCRTTFNGLVIT